jgi:hypothetical protein
MVFILVCYDQVLFLELRKLEKLAEDGVFEVNWLMELLRELIEAIFVWISSNKEIWAITEEKLTVQPSDNFKKVLVFVSFPILLREVMAVNVFKSSTCISSAYSYLFLTFGFLHN